GTQDNGSVRRDASGKDWDQVFGADGGWTQIDQLAPNRAFVEYQGAGDLFVSDDDGLNYNFSGVGIRGGDRDCFLPPYLIAFGDSTRMLYATHRVYRSVDSGATWRPISADLTDGTGAVRSLVM